MSYSPETLKTQTILPHVEEVFIAAAETDSYIKDQPLVIYSLQLLASSQIHAFYVAPFHVLSFCHSAMNISA